MIRFGSAAIILAVGVVLARVSFWVARKLKQSPAITAATGDGDAGVDGDDAAPEWLYFPPNTARRDWVYISLGVLLVTFLCPAMSRCAEALTHRPTFGEYHACAPRFRSDMRSAVYSTCC